jgi:hypothetical protein
VPSLVYENDNWFVLNVEPCLRALEMLNVTELAALSLFGRWDQSQKELFWSSYEKVKKKVKKVQIFRWLTNSTFRAVKDADDDELMNAVENLEGDDLLSGEKLREYVIWMVAAKLHDIEPASATRLGERHCE